MSRPPVPPELARGYVTADVPAIACEVRATPEDFRVEEVPLYEPCGEGEHVYLRVEKRGISTDEAIRRLARRLDVPRRAIGHAGLKDARAVTVQTLSVQGVDLGALPPLDDGQLRVVDARRHRNKLKVGHLAGNRFVIRLRGAGPEAGRARAILERLAARGVANYFGLQRFGGDRATHLLGAALVREDARAFVELLTQGPRDAAPPETLAEDEPPAAPEAEGDGDREDAEGQEEEGEGDASPPPPRRRDARGLAASRAAARAGDLALAQRALPPTFSAEHSALRALLEGRSPEACARAVPVRWRSFYVAAFQAFLFNAYLSRRLDRLDRLEAGDVATLHRNGASFVVLDPAAEQPRCDALELSPSGPLFGHKLLRPPAGSAPRALEDAVLAELAPPGTGPELTQALGARPRGERRPLRIPLRDPAVEVEGADLVLAFFLPRGSYATSVLEELRKAQTD